MRAPERTFIRLADALARPLLFRLDPEMAHEWAIGGLKLFGSLPWRAAPLDEPRLAVAAFGLNFPNPIGLAAGFDKNGETIDAMFRLGFGFVEAGTITPLPQGGNPRQRLWSLTRDEAVINRLGFPSEGHARVRARLAERGRKPGIVGVNLGANKDSPDRAGDYARGIEAFADVADYFAINVSSPNTPGLRDLQRPAALSDLLARVLEARDKAAERFGRKPVLLKIAPDLTLAELDDVIACARARAMDGMIISNTTLARPPELKETVLARATSGGLSGRPLFSLSTQLLAAAYLRVEGQFPLMGAGGVDSAERALAKIEAGARLIQLCSSLIFKGPLVAEDINRGLLRLIEQRGLARVSDAIGASAADWAAGKIGADGV